MRHDNDNQPRGLRRERAAAYLGISPAHFDKQRLAGTVPAPKHMFGVWLWDRHDLDALFEMELTAANDNESGAWADHWQSNGNPNS